MMAKTKVRKVHSISTNEDKNNESNIEELKRTLENGLYIHSSPPKVAGGSGGTKIREHIRSGNISALEEILLAGNGQSLVNQPSTDKHVRSFLKTVPAYMSKIDLVHDAAERGNLRDLKALLDRRKLSRSRDSKGIGLLHKAVLQGHKDVVDYLINEYPESVDVTDSEVLALATRPPLVVKEQTYLSTTAEVQPSFINIAFPIFNTFDNCVTKSLKGTKPPIKDTSDIPSVASGILKPAKRNRSRSSKDYYLYSQRFMVRPNSVASTRSNFTRRSIDLGSPLPISDLAAEKSLKGGVKDWLKRYSSNRTTLQETDLVNNNVSSLEKSEMQNINDELVGGMEMEIANWDQAGHCECISLHSLSSNPDEGRSDSNSGTKIDRLHFPTISPVPDHTELTRLPSALPPPIMLTMHSTDPNPEIPEYYVNTSQIMSRKARAIESHFHRVSGTRRKQDDEISPSNSIGSSFTKLPPISNVTKLRDLKVIKNNRPATPISPMITPSHSLGQRSLNSMNRGSLGSFKSLKNSHVLEDRSFSNYSIKINKSRKPSHVIIEEKDPMIPEIRCSTSETDSKKQFATSWLSVKDLISAKDEMERKAKNKRAASSSSRKMELESSPANSNLPSCLKRFVTNLYHKISIEIHHVLAVHHFSREINKQQNRKETMQIIYDHDTNFWGNMIVDKVLSSLDVGGKNPASKTEKSNILSNSFSDVVSLKQEYFDGSFGATECTDQQKDLYMYATKEIVKKDPRSRPGSGISINSFML